MLQHNRNTVNQEAQRKTTKINETFKCIATKSFVQKQKSERAYVAF